MPADPLGWLDVWVAEIRTAPRPDDESCTDTLSTFARAHATAIAKLAADPDIRRGLQMLAGSASGAKNQQDVAHAVQKFLTWSASVLQPRQAPSAVSSQSNSQVIADMRSVAEAIDAVRRDLKMLSKPLGSALSTSYLEDRQTSGNPPGFIANRRGWKLATKVKDGRNIVDLLACLSSDLREDADYRAAQIACRRQTGGKLKHLHVPIASIGGLAAALSSSLGQPTGRASPALVTAVVNCLLEPEEPLDEDTVRKRLRAVEGRKTRN